MKEKYDDAFEIIFEKKFWPHIDKTGGFFVAKIRKTRSLNMPVLHENREEKTEKEWEKTEIKNQKQSNKELKVFRGNIAPWNIQSGVTLYEHE